ncbi:TPA: hypothetical protein DDW35_04860 [Candidatus Sumerlaeota bacterium]|nr:hypothetical protein [Candidatus Sumerlaeota bacterium]
MSKKAIQALLQKSEKQIAYCQEYARLWHQFFNFFADGFENRKITSESEIQFFQLMTELARRQYRLRFLLGSTCPADESILAILSEAVSLTNLQEMSEGQFDKFQYGWHVIFIELNKALGCLKRDRDIKMAQFSPKEKAAMSGKDSASAEKRTTVSTESQPPVQGPK